MAYAYLQQVPIDADVYAKIKQRLGDEAPSSLTESGAAQSVAPPLYAESCSFTCCS